MWIDEKSKQDLQLDQLLLRFQPWTPMGKKAKEKLTPFLPGQESDWQQLLEEQEVIQSHLVRYPKQVAQLESILQQIPDVEDLILQLESGYVPSLTEWFQIKQFLWYSRAWARLLTEMEIDNSFYFNKVEIETCANLLQHLNPSHPLRSTFSIADEYDPALKAARENRAHLEREKLCERESRAQIIEEQLQVRRNRFGEWIAIRGSQQEKKMLQINDLQLIRETTYDRYFELKPSKQQEKIEHELDQLNEKIARLEQKVLNQLAKTFRSAIPFFRYAHQKITHFDLQWARIRAAESWHGSKPTYSERHLEIQEGFHPLMAEKLREWNIEFMPIQVSIKSGVTVIIGPNMGGKTAALKTIGVNVALAQFGFFVPAKSCCLPLFPWIKSIIGDGQDWEKGLSSFGAEIARLTLCFQKTGPGLLLLDEIGRGTNPIEGSSISEAVTQYLMNKEFFSIHVTHYREVLHVKGVQGYRVAGLQTLPNYNGNSTQEMIQQLHKHMDYRLLPLRVTDTIPQQAIRIAELLGLPQAIISQAKQRLKSEVGLIDGTETKTGPSSD
ncbi:MutS-related protein [Thermoflavimicrobium daqui]|nr:hypothetical protein [Thermoflavimicrobium daqui]